MSPDRGRKGEAVRMRINAVHVWPPARGGLLRNDETIFRWPSEKEFQGAGFVLSREIWLPIRIRHLNSA